MSRSVPYVGEEITREVMDAAPALSTLIFGTKVGDPLPSLACATWACRKAHQKVLNEATEDLCDWEGAGWQAISTDTILKEYLPLVLFPSDL